MRFTYDGAGRLALAQSDDPLHGDIAYSYDALGNLRTKDYLTGQWAGRNLTLSYDGQNRLGFVYDTDANGDAAWTGTRATTHDTRGNIEQYGALNMIYDMTNQPIGMFGIGTGSNGSDAVDFGSQAHLYDTNKRRVKTVERDGNGTITAIRYNIFDAAGTLVQVYDATKGERTDYVDGPNGALARIKRKQGTDTVTFIHADHLGTARSGTGWGGAEAWEDYHTPFGESLIHPDETDDQGDYTGHIRDRKTGLTYMQARYQDPLIGRFLSEDPVGMLDMEMNPSYLNRYRYCSNEPIGCTDPTGMSDNVLTKFFDFGADDKHQEFDSNLVDTATSGSMNPNGSEEILNSFMSTAGVGLAEGGANAAANIGDQLLNEVPSAVVEGDSAAAAVGTATLLIPGRAPGKSKILKETVEKTIGTKFTKKTKVIPGRGPGQSRAEIVNYKNADGVVIRTYKDSFDRAGKFQHRKPLRGGPEGRKQDDP